MNTVWIGVDLDGTLAKYEGWVGPAHIGEPVPAMLERVNDWLSRGREVRIFTARVFPHWFVPADCTVETLADLPILPVGVQAARVNESAAAIKAIWAWCRAHGLPQLAITCVKDYGMVELWDDRAVQVVLNTGQRVQDV